MSQPCQHGSQIQPVPPGAHVCEACARTGDGWVSLRQCLTCGVTLCCDSSPNRHMSAMHWPQTGHPVIRPVDLEGQDWTWCLADAAMIRETPDGWQTYDPFLEAGRWYADQHLANGGSPVPGDDFHTEDGFALGAWFAHVRELHANGALEPEDEAALPRYATWHW